MDRARLKHCRDVGETQLDPVVGDPMIPCADSVLADRSHRVGRIESTDYTEKGTIMIDYLPEAAVAMFGTRVSIEGEAILAVMLADSTAGTS